MKRVKSVHSSRDPITLKCLMEEPVREPSETEDKFYINAGLGSLWHLAMEGALRVGEHSFGAEAEK